MKKRFKYIALWLALISPLIFVSCGDDFLNVSDPTVLSAGIFPATVGDLDPVLVDIYGRQQDGYFGLYARLHVLTSHDNDHGYNGAEFNEFALNILNPNLTGVRYHWESPYLAIGKINQFLETLDGFREKESTTAAELEQLDQMEGQARFLRAMNYFYLVNLFGEGPILTAGDKQKMGVPLWDVAPTTISEANKARATQGEIYNFIIADLLAAESLLEDVEFDDVPRANEWAVKSLLGKVYIYNLQYDLAKVVLKDVIDNSGKELVSYDIYHDMYHGYPEYEFNSESIFEINYTPDKLNTGEQPNTGNRYPRYVSVAWLDDLGRQQTNGFGNFFIHDQNIPRFGFTDTTTVNPQNSPSYLAYSDQVRLDKSVDPRLYVGTFQPYVDSIFYVGVWRTVAKAREEGYSNVYDKAWCNSKYTIINYYWRDQQYSEMNFIVLRLADVYLLYAEALIETGETADGLEYINKVHRRAYDQPIDAPSPYDYATLADRTVTVDPTDPLANDPLKYERWAELFCEFNWWLDVRRWDLGADETAYYQKVKGGPLEWNDTKYAWPIPTSEINSNSEIVQNP